MKRILSLILSFVFVVVLSSCNESTSILESEKIIAVEYNSPAEVACKDYASDDYTIVTYNSSSDVVLAVERGKADYGVLDDFELNSYISADRAIKKKDTCEYSIEYCAYFNAENAKLQKSFNKAINELSGNKTLDKIIKAHLNGERFANSKSDNKNGTLIMLCDPSFEKRVYTDQNGNVVGVDVEIAREICNNLGYDLEIVTADFDELFMKLSQGEGDFIISACEVNEERMEYYLASDTYFTLNHHLIERK